MNRLIHITMQSYTFDLLKVLMDLLICINRKKALNLLISPEFSVIFRLLPKQHCWEKEARWELDGGSPLWVGGGGELASDQSVISALQSPPSTIREHSAYAGLELEEMSRNYSFGTKIDPGSFVLKWGFWYESRVCRPKKKKEIRDDWICSWTHWSRNRLNQMDKRVWIHLDHTEIH